MRGARPRHAAHAQAELDVLDDVEPGHQRVLLEHDAALGARPTTGLPSSTISPGRLHEAGDARQQRRLAATGRAERDDEVARIEREVDVGQRERVRPAVPA
jgi:hypothetical protein